MITIASLWILVILSIFSVMSGSDVRTELASGTHHVRRAKSYHLALSGITAARDAGNDAVLKRLLELTRQAASRT